MKKIKSILKSVSTGTMYYTSLFFAWIFMTAYFSKGKRTIVDINHFGEATIELIILLILIIMWTINSTILIKEQRLKYYEETI